ncbi:MAG: radical SAM family heme chaperone HemW [Bacteroidales bacterium]|nr:radical SAM family heme chaperone HemW [Bacteroidales bacterium]
MAGIYIHIPFCKMRCSYCDFFSTTNDSTASRYVDAVCRELETRRNELPNETIQTIYFGGGTPSQLTIGQFGQIFESIHANFKIEESAEITIEANPDDMTESYVSGITTLPFNRVSMGVQSFDDHDLKSLNRRHDARQALDVIELCRKNGLTNISIDLMYGLPNQTIEAWRKNVDIAISLPVQHISAYHLIYEKGTNLYRKLKKGEVKEADEELSVAMFQYLREKLMAKEFLHYEISNFALNGFFSQHNSSYWQGIPYLGIGTSAHSFDGVSRFWNPSNIKLYLEQAEKGIFSPEIEESSLHSRYNDFVIVTLRTMWGLNLIELEKRYGKELATFFLKEAEPFLKNGMLLKNGNQFSISSKGLFVSDTVMSQLLFVD